MQCKKCGSTVPDSSTFCNHCGASMTGAPPAAPATAPQPSAGGAPTERPLWSGRYSIKAMGAWILLLGGVGIVFLWCFLTLYFRPHEHAGLFGYGFLIVFLVLAVWLLIVGAKRKILVHYRLTTQRLFVEKGFISRNVDEVELIRVDDVNVHQNIIQRIFNVGDVKVLAPTDPTSPSLELEGIHNPIEVKEMIRAQTQELRKKSVRMEAI